MLLKLSGLQIALIASATVHAVLLSVRFVSPESFNRIFEDTPLEVVLVNARSQTAPDQAQLIAQAALAGGGDTEHGRATSPLLPAPQSAVGDAPEDSRKQIERLQETQQQLLTQVRRDLAALPAPRDTVDDGSPEEREQEERRRRLVQQLAEIEKRVNQSNARPKKRYISPATKEAAYAQYYDQLRRKIEDHGTRHFPEQGGQKLYGELTMNVTIDATGNVVDTEIVRASASAVLDRQAVAIVQSAAPFGLFSAKMRAQADQLVVTSRFRFTRDESLETTPLGAAR